MKQDRYAAAYATLKQMGLDPHSDLTAKFLTAACDSNELYPGFMDDAEFNNYVVGFVCFARYIPQDALRPGKRSLDVGFGQGRLMHMLATKFGMEAHGIDKYTFIPNNDSARLHILWQNLRDAGTLPLSFDFEKAPLPYPNNYFDLVTCQQVIEHLHDTPRLMLQELHRVMKPGGFFVLDTPNHASWTNRLDLIKGKAVHMDFLAYFEHRLSTKPRGEYFGHTREFTLAELEFMFTDSGFRVVTAETMLYGPSGEPVDVLNHYLTEIATVLREEYGAELRVPDRDALLPHAHKVKRMLIGCVIVATKDRVSS